MVLKKKRESAFILADEKKGRNLQAIVHKLREVFIYLNRFRKSKTEQEEKGLDDNQFLHVVCISKTYNC